MNAEVNISQHPRLPQTSIEIIAPDRPGLLATIGTLISDCGVSIASARITTLGERVEDVFDVTDKDGQPITDVSSINKIKSYITGELDQYTQQAS